MINCLPIAVVVETAGRAGLAHVPLFPHSDHAISLRRAVQCQCQGAPTSGRRIHLPPRQIPVKDSWARSILQENTWPAPVGGYSAAQSHWAQSQMEVHVFKSR